VVVVEEHAGELVIGDFDDLGPALNFGGEGDFAFQSGAVVEQRVVLLVGERVVARTLVAVGVEPGERVAVEGGPDLQSVDVRGDGY